MKNWILEYDHYDPAHEGLREALCATGNGYFVTRGASTCCRNDSIHYPGTYLAGCYDRQTSTVAGREVENEDLVNLPNWLPLTFRIGDGDWFRLDQLTPLEYHQQLILKTGVLKRNIRFQDSQGRITWWREQRFVSMANPRLAAISLELTPENWSGEITLRSGLDGNVRNEGVARYRGLESQHLDHLGTRQMDDDLIALQVRTRQSRIEIAMVARHVLYQDGHPIHPESRLDADHAQIFLHYPLTLQQDQPLRIEKTIALHSSRDLAITEPLSAAETSIVRAAPFEELLDEHQQAWKQLWEECDIKVEAPQNDDANMKLRLHIFHLLQTVSLHSIDQDVSVPARGWHGEAYRGHIFWDELFIFPYLTLRIPILTRALLRYRYRRLPEARANAQAAGLKGAMYPWQSGSTGREETQKIHLNPKSGRWLPDTSYRQRHINAAIALNIWRYYEITEDYEFLYDYGAEMFFEISRFWASLARYNLKTGQYEIHEVMGPDEYHTAYPDTPPQEEKGLNNNAYTNVMAAWILCRARDIAELLPEERYSKLREKLKLDKRELRHWDSISRNLFIPFHGDRIISQFEGYENLEEFDWDGYREKYGDIQRLDRILEAENDNVNRYKASKQADVLMLFYLFSPEELAYLFERLGYEYDRDIMPRNVSYYLQRTSHGSTLSWIVHAWVLSRISRAQAWPLFMQALNSDISDIQGGTTAEGIHLGAMAGTVDLVQRGFTGIEPRADILHFNPALPEELTCLEFRMRYRRHLLTVTITHDCLKIHSHRTLAPPITVAYRGHIRHLASQDSCQFNLIPSEHHLCARNVCALT